MTCATRTCWPLPEGPTKCPRWRSSGELGVKPKRPADDDRRPGGLHGEITVLLSGRAVHQAVTNLLATQTKSALAKHLATRTRGLDVDWISLLEEACSRTIAAVRAGQPAISLRDAERPPDA